VAGLGPVRTTALVERFGTPDRIFGASARELSDASLSMPASVIRSLAQGPDLDWACRQLETAALHEVQLLAYDTPGYPRRLREISSAPPVLWVKGILPADHLRPVGVVGTRRPTDIGKLSCRTLVQDWVHQGIRIVSGLAMGIDEIAHRTALDEGGETVAVLGNGLDQFGENQRSSLFERIAEEGLLVSELPMGTPPTPTTFPRRNRIISGLSRAVVVVEAPVNSGALITARDCLEQNRELLAVPGPVGWESFGGCHRLLRQGAALCAQSQDLAEACGWRTNLVMSLPGESEELSPVQALLRAEPLSGEEISLRLGRALPGILAELAQLEVRGKVMRLSGGVYAPA
jgi:DNA processing protein